jgi:hypothetical protein
VRRFEASFVLIHVLQWWMLHVQQALHMNSSSSVLLADTQLSWSQYVPFTTEAGTAARLLLVGDV